MRLLFRQAARRIAAVTIGAAEHDVLRGLVHRLDAAGGIDAADAFRVGLRPAFDRSSCGRASGGSVIDVEVEQKWVGRSRR